MYCKPPYHHYFCVINQFSNTLLTILAFVQLCANFVFSDNVCIGNLKKKTIYIYSTYINKWIAQFLSIFTFDLIIRKPWWNRSRNKSHFPFTMLLKMCFRWFTFRKIWLNPVTIGAWVESYGWLSKQRRSAYISSSFSKLWFFFWQYLIAVVVKMYLNLMTAHYLILRHRRIERGRFYEQ